MIDEKLLIERLEEEINDAKNLWDDDEYYIGQVNAYEHTIEIVNQLAEEQKQCIKSSCSNCETYDNEKHYCPKWCDVIENTVKELAEESNNKSLYEITLNGCDDDTFFVMELTENEYQFLLKVSEKANKTSTYGCMPRLYVEKCEQPLPAPYKPKE